MEHANPATDTTSGQPATSSASKTVKIAVMGATGSGKTTFINLASNSNLHIGSGLHSCTSVVETAQSFELNGRNVALIDTPGFDDTLTSDADILQMIARFLATEYGNGETLAGVIYMHRISDFRVGGTSTRNFKMFRQLCGDSTLKNVVIVTNMWSEVSEVVGTAREAELKSEDLFFKPVLEKGAQMLRHGNTPASAHAILSHIINNHPLPLQIQKELVDENKDITDTAAGEELNREMDIQLEKQREEMRQLKKETEDTIRARDEENRRALEAETRRMEQEMAQAEIDRQNFELRRVEEMQRLEKEAEEQREAARREAERRDAEHNEHMRRLQQQLADAEMARMFQRMGPRPWDSHPFQNGHMQQGFSVSGECVIM